LAKKTSKESKQKVSKKVGEEGEVNLEIKRVETAQQTPLFPETKGNRGNKPEKKKNASPQEYGPATAKKSYTNREPLTEEGKGKDAQRKNQKKTHRRQKVNWGGKTGKGTRNKEGAEVSQKATPKKTRWYFLRPQKQN